MFVVVDDHLSVDEYVFDSFWVERWFVGASVHDTFVIEDYYVGAHSFLDFSAVADSGTFGGH